MPVVCEFIDKMGYLANEDVEGIIFYGSYQTHTNNEASDIDVIVLFNDATNQNIKGYMKVHNIEVEYYERTLAVFYKRAENDFKNAEDTLFSAVGHGQIIFDRNGNADKLQKYILDLFSNPLPKLNRNGAMYIAKSVSKAIDKLKYYAKEDCDFFTVYYGLTLEKLRVFYHRLNGCSSLTLSSVYKIYTNSELQKIQYKTMPDSKFVSLYLLCLNVSNENKFEYLKRIHDLFEYSIRDLNIDFNNLRIDIENKNH